MGWRAPPEGEVLSGRSLGLLRTHCCTPADSPSSVARSWSGQRLWPRSAARFSARRERRQTSPAAGRGRSTGPGAAIALDRLAASARDAPARAPVERASRRARSERLSSRCGRNRLRGSRDRGRSSPGSEGPPADPSARAGERSTSRAKELHRERLAGTASCARNLLAGSATRRSRSSSRRERRRAPRLAARSRSCARPGGCPASRARGGERAGTGPAADRHVRSSRRAETPCQARRSPDLPACRCRRCRSSTG